MASFLSCCIKPQHDNEYSNPTETTHLLGGDAGPSTPIIDRQPAPHPGLQEDDEELDAIFGDMIETMVRPKQANPFLTGTASHTPSTSRNPSPRSLVSSSRGQRSQSRGRTTNAFQIRRVRTGRNGQKVPQGPDVVQEEEEQQNGHADGTGSSITCSEAGPTRSSTQNREELENQQYTIRLKTDDIVKPWRSQISDVD